MFYKLQGLGFLSELHLLLELLELFVVGHLVYVFEFGEGELLELAQRSFYVGDEGTLGGDHPGRVSEDLHEAVYGNRY